MSEAKPGPCPACGSSSEAKDIQEPTQTMSRVFCTAASCWLWYYQWARTLPEAIAAWNGIRARVLREAAEIVNAELGVNEGANGPAVAMILGRAANRAERGEP